MDLKTAYRVLDLPADATKQDLEARFYERTDKRIPAEEAYEIQDAYNAIKAELERLNPPPEKPFKEKFFDFLYIYKIQLIVGAFALVVIASISYTLISGISEQQAIDPIDLHIAFFGDFADHEDTEPLEAAILARFPEWDEVKVDIVYAPGGPNTMLDFELSQISQAYLVTTKPDIFIFDDHYFEIYDDDTVFAPLEGFADGAGRYVNDDGDVIGFDVTDDPLFSDMLLADDPKFLTVPIGPEDKTNARAFIQQLVN